MLDDPTSYREYHPVKVGIGLQGIGVTMILLTTLHLFRYNEITVHCKIKGLFNSIDGREGVFK